MQWWFFWTPDSLASKYQIIRLIKVARLRCLSCYSPLHCTLYTSTVHCTVVVYTEMLLTTVAMMRFFLMAWTCMPLMLGLAILATADMIDSCGLKGQ